MAKGQKRSNREKKKPKQDKKKLAQVLSPLALRSARKAWPKRRPEEIVTLC